MKAANNGQSNASFKNKKAQVEVQFNWIFILIVGAIILSFFVTIAVRQKGISEQEINIAFFTNFEKALSGIAAVEGKMLLFEVPKMDLRYDCTPGCDCAAYAGTSRAKVVGGALFSFKDKIIFSPNSLKGNNLLTWSKDWSYPFRITNFLFMTSPEVKYLIEDTSHGKVLFENLPPIFIQKEQKEQRAFDKQLLTQEQIEGQTIPGITGNYKVKFVFTETDPVTTNFNIPTALKDLPNSDVTAIKIENEKVTFYQKNDLKFEIIGESYLFGEATTYASIFAEDLNAYGCMMNRAMKSFNMVSRIYQEKQLQYFIYPVLEAKDCKIHYVGTAISNLIKILDDFNFKEQEDASSITNNVLSFATQNDNALKDSCPHIY